MSHLRKAFRGKTATEIKEAADKVVKLLKSTDDKKSIRMTDGRLDLSIRDVAEATLGDDGMDALRNSGEDGSYRALSEAVDPVNLSAFTNITQNMVLQGVMEQYKAPQFIGDQLVTAESSNEDNTRIPGLTPISDDVLEVKEGEEYPDVKFGEDYQDIPRSKKRGQKIGITKEMVFFDRTGMVMDMARGVGERMGMNKEIRILRVVLGVDDNFVRKGVARDTYVATGGGDPRVNQLAGTDLIDWTDIDEVMQLFQGMADDRASAEPILVAPDTLLVTQARWATANRIFSATEVRSTNGTEQTIAGNPVAGLGMKVLTSPLILWVLVNKGLIAAANAKKYWHIGQFKKAFTYRTLFPLQLIAARHDKDEFERDVVAQFRASERGVCYVKAPWYVAQVYDS